jgi:uncharacterized YigZ family protein
MAEYRYRVTTRAGEAELRAKGSRFAAWVGPVESESDAAARLAAFAGRSSDATHHCWAQRLGQPVRERASDAGEPTGTAGTPMLQVLRGADVSDTLALVARWFGGIKLGKGGLARAYAGVVRAALDGCLIGERLRYETLEVEMPYSQFGAVQRLVHPPQVVLGGATYGEIVRCTLRVLPPERTVLLDQLAALGLEVEPGGEEVE